MKSDRPKFIERKVRLIADEQIERAIAVLRNAPLDPLHPLEFLLREEVKARKPDQNSLMWAGPLKDISEQVWVERRQFSADVWNEHLKELFLPEEFDPELCKDGYVKWGFSPSGKRALTGSSKDLTIKGFTQYLDQIHAFGGNHGVEFHEAPNREQG